MPFANIQSLIHVMLVFDFSSLLRFGWMGCIYVGGCLLKLYFRESWVMSEFDLCSDNCNSIIL